MKNKSFRLNFEQKVLYYPYKKEGKPGGSRRRAFPIFILQKTLTFLFCRQTSEKSLFFIHFSGIDFLG